MHRRHSPTESRSSSYATNSLQVIEQGEEWLIAHCLEVPAALGQGKTREDVLENLAEAILLMLDMEREERLREAPIEAVREVIVVQ